MKPRILATQIEWNVWNEWNAWNARVSDSKDPE